MMLTMSSTGTMLTSRRRMYSRMEPLQGVRGVRSRDRAARLADHQRDGYRPVPLGDVIAGDQGEQGIRRHLPELDQRVTDGGEGRRGVARRRDVVEADQGDVFGDADAGLVAATEHADRGAVVERGDGGRAVGTGREPFEQVVEHGPPALDLARAAE